MLDRWGDLYPGTPVDRIRLAAADDSLSGYYETAKRNSHPDWMHLLSMYGVNDGADFMSVWQSVQDSIVARTIRDAAEVAGRGPLVVLIHGFNTNEREAVEGYAAVRNVLRQKGYRDGGILEVYWDGRTDLGNRLRNPHAWRRAQHNAYGVGLGLRRILSAVPHQTPVRILTHSHGGKIATVALWNVTSAIPKTRDVWRTWYDSLRMDTLRYRTPAHPDLRLAALVPAMPGNVIGDRSLGAHSSTPPGATPPVHRLVIGQNRRDQIVQKRFIPGISLRAFAGSTTLGASPSEYNHFAPAFNPPGREPVAFCVDFADVPDPHDHKWTSYMQRAPIDEVLRLLFRDVPPTQSYPCPS